MTNDNVCLVNSTTSNTCTLDFDFFTITSATGTNGLYDGVLGMGPPAFENGPSFIEALISQGSMYEPVVGFQITTTTATSEI
jgi:hypothetical protein